MKHSHRNTRRLGVATGLVLALVGAGIASAETVTPDDLGPDAGSWHTANESGGGSSAITATQPDDDGGLGSLEQTLDPDGTTDFQIFSEDTTYADDVGWQAPTGFGELAELDGVSFDWFRDDAGSSTAPDHDTPITRLYVYDPDAGTDGSSYLMVWEGVHNAYPTSGAAAPVDQWVNEDATDQNWWRIPLFDDGTAVGNDTCDSDPTDWQCRDYDWTLADWQGSDPTVPLGPNTVVFGAEAGLGTWSEPFHSFFDDLTLDFSTGSVDWDFEPTPESVWTPLEPARLVDTRGGIHTTSDGLFEGEGQRAAGASYEIDVTGRADVPDDATSVIVNLTAVDATKNGYMTAYPCTDEVPNASSINFTVGVNLPNELVAGLDADGKLCIYTHVATDMALDVVGYVAPSSPYEPLEPARLADTRAGYETVDGESAGEGAPGAGGTLTLQVAGRGNVPADASAAVLNVTAANAAENGYITVHPCEPITPNASSLNYTTGVNRANEVVSVLDADGKVCIYTHKNVDVVVDVVGSIPDGTNYTPLDAPVRLLETRSAPYETIDGEDTGIGKLQAGSSFRLTIGGRAGIPEDTLETVVLNLTAVEADAAGYATVYPCNDPRPLASSLNFVVGVNGGNELIAGVADGNDICIYMHKTAHVNVDVAGYTTVQP